MDIFTNNSDPNYLKSGANWINYHNACMRLRFLPYILSVENTTYSITTVKCMDENNYIRVTNLNPEEVIFLSKLKTRIEHVNYIAYHPLASTIYPGNIGFYAES